MEEEMVVCDLSDITNENTLAFEKSCYCGFGRRHSEVEVYCTGCCWWYHSSCVDSNVSMMALFSTNYNFVCRNCSPEGKEHFQRREAGVLQMCHTCLANLISLNTTSSDRKEYYHIDEDIASFIESHWDSLTTIPKKPRSSWKSVIHEILIHNDNWFISSNSAYLKLSSELNDDIPTYFTLNSHFLGTISSDLFSSSTLTFLSSILSTQENPKRSISKRGQDTGAKSRTKKEQPVKLNTDGFPAEHPFNRESYFWHYAEPDPNAPFRSQYEDCLDGSSNLPIPSFLYRPWHPQKMTLSYVDRAHQLNLSDNLMEVTGFKGYSMVRATHGVRRGTWFWECTVTSKPEDAHLRIGFSRRFATTQAPCGYDELGYSWRSRKGTLFHNSKGVHFSDGFGEGDVLGFLLHLPGPSQPLVESLKSKHLVRYRGSYYFEERVDIKKLKDELRPAQGSYIEFFKNGQSVGVGFTDIFEGEYFPAISLFKSAVVCVNFGDSFKAPPITDTFYRSFSEVVLDYNIESTMADALFFSQNMNKISNKH